MRVNSKHSGLLPALLIAGALCAPFTSPAYDLIAPVTFWAVGDVNWKENLIGNGTSIPIPTVGSPLQDGSTSWGQALQKTIDELNAVIPDHVLTLSITQDSGIAAGNQDDVNNVAFADTVYGNAWGGSTVGISLSLWSGNRRIENDVLFNATKTWDSYTGAQQGGVTDFRRIALHEFGHSLGLDHPDEAGQVVSAIMNSVSSDIYQLQQDDIDGLLSIYGAIMSVAIAQHPQSYKAPVGGTWPFSVVATGSELITYDWEQSTNDGATWSDIGFDSTTTMGSFSGLIMAQDGMQIRVIVTNPAGSLMSEVATLTVTASPEAPAITSHPSDTSVAEGGGATFTVAASGSATPGIQWQSSSNGGATWSNIIDGAILPTSSSYSGTTSTQITISSAAAALDGRMYRAVATNTAGSENSNGATLTVTGVAIAPSITAQPSVQTAVVGSDVIFSVIATGTAPFTYQWKRNGANINGATESSYTVSNVQPGSAGNYTVVVSNDGGSATSNAATLTIDTTPRLINVSCRAVAGSGDSTLIVGFFISGTGSKTLLIRGVGPRLLDFVPPPVVADPVITVYDKDDFLIATNNDWDPVLAADFTRVGAFELNPGSKDAAFKVTLEPGLYTVHLVNSGPIGEGLIEVYDFSRDLGSRLTNVSCRLDMNPNQLVILGTALISGQTGALLRNVGPGIAQYLPDPNSVLADPHLRVFTGPNEIAVNDDWELATRAYFGPTGAFDLPNGSKDAATRVVLTLGENTAHATGNGGGGIAIIELYESP